jgi:3-dehydro-L-gulonate 2-dehydrogenase
MTKDDNIILIHDTDMKAEFKRILLKVGFSESRAGRCAEIFTQNSLEGVYSHGVNRFPVFVKYIKKGYVKPGAEPSLIKQAGSLEQWNGNQGPGPLNAEFATVRAMQLALEYGIGMVAMANTNHWMRGGTYGWQAARKGFVFIGWTNTCANMPAWGAKDPRLGNNPFVIGVPFKNEAIVMDFAMTQFSYGKMGSFKLEGKELPYPGGYNKLGELTQKPDEILETWRALPIGYWKGAGLSLLLDILATILSGGIATNQISSNKDEYGVSQVFIAICISKLHNYPSIENTINQIIEDYKRSEPETKETFIRYPGENIVLTRDINSKNGIPVNRGIWGKIQSL